MGILPGLIAMFGWGVVDFLSVKSSRKIGSILTFFWMQIVGFLIALIYLIFNFQKLYVIDISKLVLIIIISAFLFTIGTFTFYKGLIIGQASLVTPIMGSWAMITAILSIIFLNEILKTNQILAIIFIICGIILVSTNIKEALKNKLSFFIGAKEGIISMFSYGVAAFLLAFAVKSLGWFLPGIICRLFILIFIILYAFINKQSLRARFQPSVWNLILPIAFLDIIAFFAYSIGVSSECASIVAPIAASSPLVTIILARIFLKEKLVSNQIVGIFLALLGLVLISIK
jgi:drug/metabolite transporter (DMT)-like permease